MRSLPRRFVAPALQYAGNLVVVSTNSTNSSTDPNINLSARANSSVNVGMYCNPGWLSADGGTFTYPEAGDSVYAASEPSFGMGIAGQEQLSSTALLLLRNLPC